MTVYLNYGLGADSTEILRRWIVDPSSRNFSLDDLVLVTAMTGNEFGDSQEAGETYLLPLLRQHNIRYVQLARAGRSQKDGIVVLSDTRQPDRLYIEGAGWSLADEMMSGGTVPQVAATGGHQCAIKYKGWVIDQWLRTKQGARRSVLGYNADERERAAKAREYPEQNHEFPLIEWRVGREQVMFNLLQYFGIVWPKSCCTMCPFSNTNGGRAALVERYRGQPDAGALAALIEHLSVALNPRMTLYGGTKTVLGVLIDGGLNESIRIYEQRLEETLWAIYRVRRIYHPVVTGKRPTTDRSTTIEHQGSRADMERMLRGYGHVDKDGGIGRVYVRRRFGTDRPALEEFYVALPNLVDEKQKKRFDQEWIKNTWEERELRPIVSMPMDDVVGAQQRPLALDYSDETDHDRDRA